MTVAPPALSERTYDLGFARWVYEHVDGGDKLSLCMQCGMCSGSCPIGTEMDHGPRKLFMMIRAGMKDAVFNSDTIWNCTSCYNCVTRCPRGVPVTYIIQDLAAKAVEFGYVKKVENARFAKAFWWSAAKFGRTDERLVTTKFYLSGGLVSFVRKSLANLKIAIGMVRTRRMHLGMPHKIKDVKGLQAILAKAAEIEARESRGGE
jgi:quinone-modifying oxidoreductase subunit QmoC